MVVCRALLLALLTASLTGAASSCADPPSPTSEPAVRDAARGAPASDPRLGVRSEVGSSTSAAALPSTGSEPPRAPLSPGEAEHPRTSSVASAATDGDATDVGRFLPCIPGLSVESSLVTTLDAPTPDAPSAAPTTKRTALVDTVRGLVSDGRGCIIDRTSTSNGRTVREARVLERLSDRVVDAGWVDQPLAFRPPLLVGPVEVGRRWHFNTVDYAIVATGARVTVPAGTFEGCVRVLERATRARFEATSVYAPGVGLIEARAPGRVLEATRVVRPENSNSGAVKSRHRPR